MPLLIAATALLCMDAHARDILIRAAKVHTVTSRGTLEHTDVLVRDERIAAVGIGLTAAGATVIDAGNRPLTPGLFGGLSAIGLMEVPAEPETDDSSISFAAPAWQQQWRPELDVTLAYNPRSTIVPVTRIEGLTWAMVGPWSDTVIGGQGGAVTLDGRYDAVLDGSRSLFVSWDGGASGNGGSRAALYMMFQQAISEVRATAPVGEGALLHPAGREALAAYLAGGRVVFYAERAADIRQLIGFAARNGMKPVISGGAEAWVVANELARAQVPVILNPLDNLPSNFDQIGARFDNAVRLQRAGVGIAFSSGDIHNADPLEVTSLADQVWIGGREIEMHSRQTQLRDRYFKRSAPDDSR